MRILLMVAVIAMAGCASGAAVYCEPEPDDEIDFILCKGSDLAAWCVFRNGDESPGSECEWNPVKGRNEVPEKPCGEKGRLVCK